MLCSGYWGITISPPAGHGSKDLVKRQCASTVAPHTMAYLNRFFSSTSTADATQHKKKEKASLIQMTSCCTAPTKAVLLEQKVSALFRKENFLWGRKATRRTWREWKRSHSTGLNPVHTMPLWTNSFACHALLCHQNRPFLSFSSSPLHTQLSACDCPPPALYKDTSQVGDNTQKRWLFRLAVNSSLINGTRALFSDSLSAEYSLGLGFCKGAQNSHCRLSQFISFISSVVLPR